METQLQIDFFLRIFFTKFESLFSIKTKNFTPQ